MSDVAISDTPLDPREIEAGVLSPSRGASLVFTGIIRDHNAGKRVVAVSYDVFEPLCLEVFRELAAEARAKWGPDLAVAIAHRRGKLHVGDVAVVIAVGAPHRDETYRASRFLIEEVKHRAPIWKKEHYEGGESEWVQGHALCGHR